MINIAGNPSKDVATLVLQEFSGIMDELGIPFMLDGGTLLGAYRDHDFCDDDQDDIDLTALFKHASSMKAITLLAESAGFRLYHKWNASEWQQKYNKITSSQISFRKMGVKIDLMFKHTTQNKIWWTIFSGDEVVYKSIPIAFVFGDNFSMAEIKFKNQKFYIPVNVDEYLKYRYGDFNVKVHRSEYCCYSTDKSICSYEECIGGL
jgi:phosphorylcholine metabolism protein LicD